MLVFLKVILFVVSILQAGVSHANNLDKVTQALEKAKLKEAHSLIAFSQFSEPHSEKLKTALDQLGIPPEQVLLVRVPLMPAAGFKTIYLGSDFVREIPLDVLRFVLAHELGHVVLKHSHQKVAFIANNFPEEASSVEDSIHKVPTPMNHKIEYEADTFAKNMLIRLGYYDPTLPAKTFMFLAGFSQTTRTHPSNFDRIDALK